MPRSLKIGRASFYRVLGTNGPRRLLTVRRAGWASERPNALSLRGWGLQSRPRPFAPRRSYIFAWLLADGRRFFSGLLVRKSQKWSPRRAAPGVLANR